MTDRVPIPDEAASGRRRLFDERDDMHPPPSLGAILAAWIPDPTFARVAMICATAVCLFAADAARDVGVIYFRVQAGVQVADTLCRPDVDYSPRECACAVALAFDATDSGPGSPWYGAREHCSQSDRGGHES